MKRRISSFILVALIMISIIPLAVFANGSETEYLDAMTLTVDTVTVANDDESVSVSIKVERNSGFAGVQYQLVYDKDVFSLESDPVVGDIDGMTLVASGPLDAGKHMCMLSTSNGSNTVGDGTLVTYTFNIDENAPAGTYGFSLITEGTADLPDGGTVPLEILDENQQKVASVVLNGSVTIPGYKISYDANGGIGAPEGTTKSKNVDVAISKTIPERDGFNFLGWSTNPVSTKPQYKGGDMYSDNADVVLYAVWKNKPETVGAVKMEVETVDGRTGSEVQVKVNITDNPEIHSMVFDVVYDEQALEFVSVEKGLYANICVEHASKLNYQYMDLYNFGNTMTETGTLLTFTFRIKQEAAEGLAEINVVPDYDTFIKLVGEQLDEGYLDVDVTSGGVVVSTELAGDINHDEKVNADDAVLLLNHLTHDEAIEYKGSLDFNGDGEEEKGDVAALLRFILFPDDFSIEEASLAAETETVYTFESKLGYIGEEIEVVISLEACEAFKASGIANISYDEDVFTLNSCDLTNEFGVLASFENFSDKTIVALDENDIASYNGTFAVLGFTINENAQPGEYTITGTPGLANSGRLECSVKAGTITVKDVSEKPIIPVTDISFDKTTALVAVGETIELSATVEPADATNKEITFESSDEEVAVVDAKGNVRALSAGSAKITARTENGKIATCTVTVGIPADAVEFTPLKFTSIAVNKTMSFKAKAVCLDGTRPYSAAVTYEIVEGNEFATIDEKGKLYAVAEGDVVVRARALLGTDNAYDEVKIKICVPATKVTLNKTKAAMALGYGDLQLAATLVAKEECTDSLTWSVDKPEIATVDENGLVTAHDVGKVKVTAMSGSGKKATCTVTVGEPATAVEISSLKSTSVAVGKTLSLKGKAVRDDDIKPVSTAVEFEIIEGEEFAEIDANGKLRGIGIGEVVVRVRAEAGTPEAYKDIAINVCVPATKIKLDKTTASMALGYGELKLSAEITPVDHTDTVFWSVDKPEIATVDENGLVTAHDVGKVKVTAMSGSGKKATCTVTIGEPATAVDISSIKITSVAVDKYITLKGKAVRDDDVKPVSTAVEFEIIDGEEFAELDANGKLCGIAEGEVTVRIKAEAGTEEAYEDVVIRVCVPATKVTLDKTKAAMALGYGDLQLAATLVAKEECTDSLTWSVDKPEIATVDENGLVTAHDVGKVKVTAMSGSGKKATCTVTVGLAADTVEFSSLKATSLAVGKTLSLKAKASREDGEKPVSTAVVFEILDGEEFAELDAKGKIKALAEGTLTVRARAEAGTYDAYADVEIRVCVPATKVTLNMTKATIEEAGEEFQLEAVMTPEDHSDILIWSSSNENVATVDENGLVTAHATGIVKITAMSGSGKSAACTVTIGIPATRVKLNMTRATVYLSDEDLWLEGTMTPEENSDALTWTSSDEDIATVDENGLVTLHSAGKVKITATAGSGKSAACTVTVKE